MKHPRARRAARLLLAAGALALPLSFARTAPTKPHAPASRSASSAAAGRNGVAERKASAEREAARVALPFRPQEYQGWSSAHSALAMERRTRLARRSSTRDLLLRPQDRTESYAVRAFLLEPGPRTVVQTAPPPGAELARKRRN